jgi:hypothetical protein
MAVLSDHHWAEREKGLRELRRVARHAVVFTFDPEWMDATWLLRDYLPQFRRLPGMTLAQIVAALGATQVQPVPIPHDCQDGFFHAYWRRPHAYLDPMVRAGISVFQRLEDREVEEFTLALASDLESGAWHERNAAILELDALECGYRLLTA